jgi:mannose-6-phosphate isomerase-like protein (cupin superfamily)
MSEPGTTTRIGSDEARAAPIPAGARSALLMRHGSMTLRYYRPPRPDPQQPHEQDELYFVARGSGWFLRNGKRHECRAGDVLFAAAGEIHRFEDFSDDFETWVVFWGPKGGETA